MRRDAKTKGISSAAFSAATLLALVSAAQAESRWDGLSVNQFDTNFFKFQSGAAPQDPLQERGIETDLNAQDTSGSASRSTNFYDRPRNVFETGGKER